MLDSGVLLTSPIEVKEIAGKKVFNVADGFLFACFDANITDETVKDITQTKPCDAVFHDLTFVASTGESDSSFEMRYEDENIWLTQKMMAELYDVDVRTINEHIKKIYKDGELTESATIRKFRIVQAEGTRQVSRDVFIWTLRMKNLKCIK